MKLKKFGKQKFTITFQFMLFTSQKCTRFQRSAFFGQNFDFLFVSAPYSKGAFLITKITHRNKQACTKAAKFCTVASSTVDRSIAVLFI